MNEILTTVLNDINREKIDGVWINPRVYHLGKIKHFYAMRELAKPYGICLAYIEDGIVDTHCWYFYKNGDPDIAGWLKVAHDP